jgi:hypothetical protein
LNKLEAEDWTGGVVIELACAGIKISTKIIAITTIIIHLYGLDESLGKYFIIFPLRSQITKTLLRSMRQPIVLVKYILVARLIAEKCRFW